jgi:hypothetical protein
MPEPYVVPADGPDVFRCFVIPLELPGDRFVGAVEFQPGNRSVLHHSIFFLDRSGAARALDAADPEAGYRSFGGPGFQPVGALGGWAPGHRPHPLPAGVGKLLRKGSDLVLQNHYHPTGKAERDLSAVGLYFLEAAPSKVLVSIPIIQRRLDIPPDVARHRVSTSFTTPLDLELIGIAPHMHYLGREMKLTANLPNGRVEPLIWIADWDFNWQGVYDYDRPLTLPRGTRIDLEAIYDNTSNNARNPNSPPQRVFWGESHRDEMALCLLHTAVDPTVPIGVLADAILNQPGLRGSDR